VAPHERPTGGRVRARPRPARAGSSVRFVPVSDLLVLAAIERAECHEQLEGVQWRHVPMHLGFAPAAATTRKLRLQVDELIEAGEVRQFRRGGSKVWGLTDAGRARLAVARQDGTRLELPEAPQRWEWRRARAKAEREIEWLQDELRTALEQVRRAPSGGRVVAAVWLQHGERLRKRCEQLAVAHYCLHEWSEPVDSEPDGQALCDWLQALARGPIDADHGDPELLVRRLRRVRGVNGGSV
jgi:hypothetical protein